jgi:2-amino-4-hydroxy-6-hydroxymethyldihydropteridine diphosphokinase
VEVYLGLGANTGDRRANLEKALGLLGERLCIDMVSSVYETEPVGYEDQPPFLNAVCCVTTDIGPLQLLSLVKGIEATMGRVPNFTDGPRPIDIDIIIYGKLVMVDPELTIPHPRMGERAFVLVPLAEIAPDLIHPFSGESIGDMLAKVGGKDGVKKTGNLEVADV